MNLFSTQTVLNQLITSLEASYYQVIATQTMKEKVRGLFSLRWLNSDSLPQAQHYLEPVHFKINSVCPVLLNCNPHKIDRANSLQK